MRRLTVLAATLAALVIAGPATGCSMAPGYKVLTSLELAAEADTIVVAMITEERKADEQYENALVLRPTMLLKGSVLPAEVTLDASYLANDDQSRSFAFPSDPRELRQPHPASLIGGCVRYIFSPGMQLVLFLKDAGDGRFTPIRHSFSRDAEDVSGPDALWARVVREYAMVSALPKADRRERLRQRIAELRAMPSDVDAEAIAADMEVELKGRRLWSHD